MPLLAAIGADCVFASHHHHNHGRHHHVHLKPHAQQIQPRDVDRLDRIPAGPKAKIRTTTTTTTTTVFEDCPSTILMKPAATTIIAELIHVPTNGVAVSAPAVIAPKPEWINSMSTESMSTNSIPTHPMPSGTTPALIHVAKPSLAQDEQITTIGMTTTVTKVQTVNASTNITNVAPSSATATSVETKMSAMPPASPVPTATAKIAAPPAAGPLPLLPEQLLENAPQELVSALPLSILPQPLGQALDLNGPSLPSDLDWTAIPEGGNFATERFGGRSQPSGTQIKYQGNVGIPWGSNVISVSPTEAHQYKYVVRFTGANTEPWTITIWNKVGPDGKMDGWYGHSALTFILAPGETRYIAFDEDSEGAWGAAPGTNGLPVDNWGGYTSTWGEFSFGDAENDGWSGWDVSAIQAQLAKQDVQGMRICMADGRGCSIITPQAKKVVDAYTESNRQHDGIGGAASPGPVRLVVDIDYQG
ncbi:Allergen Asp f 4 [Penicillium rolfsii]|nr:Allergen Asp f 4 [Penicillium rolfsii]